MSGLDDYDDEMFPRRPLDDDTIEGLLVGRQWGQADLTLLFDFVEDVRAAAQGPVPAMAPQLTALMAECLDTEHRDRVAAASGVAGSERQAAEPQTPQRKRFAIAQTLTRLSIRAKAALGLGVAAVAVTGAGAAGALPGPVQHVVAITVGAVTPFDLPDATSSHADLRRPTSGDAKGARDGQPGVDGRSIASTAPDNGLSVTGDTPAGGHVPVSVPGGAHSSESSDVGSARSASSHEPSSQRADVPDDSGSQHAKVPDDPGSPRADVPDDSGAHTPGPLGIASATHDAVSHR